MSYNSNNFYSNFHPNFTFRDAPPGFIPPPPPPPPFMFNPSFRPPQISDQDFVRHFEKPDSISTKVKSTVAISTVKKKLRNLVLTLNELKEKEKYLQDNISTVSDKQWQSTLAEIKKNKAQISECMVEINDTYLDTLRKLLAKRSAKRLRLKRLKLERKKEREELIKEREERSRKIDENLQKIKDEIEKAKQEEQAKIEADIILKEVLRKKHDANKCIAKLEALQKLYKARQNTARGRGEVPPERNAEVFNSNAEKLKAVWAHKLVLYSKEEAELRATLKQDTDRNTLSAIDEKIAENLAKWREFLFGSEGPQVNFHGDVGRFVAVRSQWDQYINAEGSPLPVGWVVPNIDTPNT